MTEARFDDLRSHPARSFRFDGLLETLEAREPSEVPGVLAALDAASVRGLWAAGYLAYEAAPGIDHDLAVRERDVNDPFSDMPLAWFGLFERREDAAPLAPSEAAFSVWRWEPSVSRRRYDEQIARIHEAIASGETYQVNLTMRLRGRFAGTDRAFYTALCLSQRGANAAYLDLGRYRILSASPELFVELEGGRLRTRPMKGTAPRGRWPDEDIANADALLASQKERAENAMIVDLLRNDMGRISEAGSVGVDSLFDLERYETVWQLTSTIDSQLRRGLGVADVLAGLFPSGSVTGAPKIRSMQLIAELEEQPRGVYCGSIGWIAPVGAPGVRASFNVAIRTVVLDTETGTAEYGVGGGITFDSVASREYAECVAKSRVLTERRPAFELLESIGYRDGQVLWLDRHLDRITASARSFDFDLDPRALRDAIERVAAEAVGDAKIRITLTREGEIHGEWAPIDPLPPEGTDLAAIRIAIDDERVSDRDVFLFHKTTRREVYERASSRHPDAEDVALQNQRGEITEATSSNIAALVDDAWVTPPVASGLLGGIYRQVLLEEGRIREQVIPAAALREAKEIALLNSVRLWRPATLID